MGRATVISGGTDGRYVIEMDYGLAQRNARVAKIDALLAELADRRIFQQDQVDGLQGGLESLQAEVTPKIEAYRVVLSMVPQIPEAIEIVRKNLDTLTAQIIKQQLWLAQAVNALAHTDLEIQQATLDRAALMAVQITEQRPAWCADLTETAAGAVATLEIPGESALILISPGALAPVAADGVLTAREIQSPEQVYWNAAVLPGWQKFKPTYRWGTITALDATADTATVDLAPAVSSARSLDVNQAVTLTGVPVVYMTCNASVFNVGDRVVVGFTGQDWAAPRVIGFVDTPRACGAVHYTCIPAATTGETWGWTVPLTSSGAPINGGKGTPATIVNRSYSGVHVPVKSGVSGLEFARTRFTRAQQNSVPPNVPEIDGFYNSYLSSTDYASTPYVTYNTYDGATPNLTSSLHSIAREWVSPDRKTCVTTALGDVRVNGESKGNPISFGLAAWACVMNKATPTLENPALTTRYIALWTWNAPLISVYTRPLLGGDWALIASKSVVDYDPNAMDGSYFEDYPIEELDPQTCWMRKGARNLAGNVCSMWAQTPRYWRFTTLGEAGIWAWVLDFDIDAGVLTDTQMGTETVSQVGPPAPYTDNASISQSGTRHIDFEYDGNTKAFTTLTFSGSYSYTAVPDGMGGLISNAETSTLKIVLDKGAYSLTLYEDAFTKANNTVVTADVTYVALWYYGRDAICYHRLKSTASASTREFRIDFPESGMAPIDLIPPATGSVATPIGRLSYPFTGTASGQTRLTPFLSDVLRDFSEYEHYRDLAFSHRDRSMLNFRALDNTYLISLPAITFDTGDGWMYRLTIDPTSFKTWCSDPDLFALYGIDAEEGVLKHIKLA